MVKAFGIYVPASATGNLERGLKASTWGLRDILGIADNRRTIESINDGDVGMLAHKGPNPRVPFGEWRDATFAEVHVVRFTSRMSRSNVPIWADELYPLRLPFELIESTTDLHGVTLGPDVTEALRRSANTQGAPQPIANPEFSIDPGRGHEHSDTDDAPLDLPGSLDLLVTAISRREQKQLRARKFGSKQTLACDFCATELPRRFMTAAHIKPRRLAGYNERRDLANILCACPQCDLLFEWGYIAVEPNGLVKRWPTAATSDLDRQLNALAGRQLTTASTASTYLNWHAAHRFGAFQIP